MANRRARHWLVSVLSLAVFSVVLPRSSVAQTRGPFLGSVPTGQATGTTIDVSLHDALARALKYNLGEIESSQNTRAAHAVRLRSLNALLPNLSARLSGTIQQLDLPSEGLTLLPLPIHLPETVGPYGIADARGYLSQEIFNWSDIKNLKSASASEKASEYTYKSDRNLVVFTTGNAYLLVISDIATVESVRAQVTTAQTLVQNDVDLNKHGLIASIDLLRARVELQTQQQRLIAAQNQVAIDKLTLARVIGLPSGQEFRLTDSVPYTALDGITQEQALQQALATRPDYLSAKAQVQAAELTRQAVAAENYPSLTTDTNYGDIGSPNFGSSHGTLGFALTLNVPIFQGSRVRADKLQADSALQQRKAELADLEGQIDNQVRTAFFNLTSSSELVKVAESNIDLANQTQSQAQDRFRAGVADNLEVVQAQESVAAANQSYINSLYAFNLAKISLAQALGVAEQSTLKYLGAK
ncbi:MAG: TolC family protein [Terriglobia bacterium]